ncbi:MAG: phage major capsid protein [Spirochaetes bacterium]|nr:phage major capsid protein [Spirochaetota bacterium]
MAKPMPIPPPGSAVDAMYIRALALGEGLPDDAAEKAIVGGVTFQQFARRAAQPIQTQKREQKSMTENYNEKYESTDPKNILAMGEQFHMRDDAIKFVQDGRTVGEFRAYVLEKKTPVIIDNSPNYDGPFMSRKDYAEYSLLNAIKNQVEGKRGIEVEISEQMSRDMKKHPRGLWVPDKVLQRGLTVGSNTSAGYLTGSTVRPELVPLLREALVTAQMGATIISGLNGNSSVKLPRQKGAAVAYWVSEGNAPTASVQTTDQITLEPKTVAATTSFSRQLMLQSAIDIEQFVTRDLVEILAREIDRVAINGTGTGNEPTGVLHTAGIGNVGTSPSAPSYQILVDLYADLAAANAARGSLAYLSTSAVAVKLMTLFTNASYGEVPLLGNLDREGVGRVANLGLPFFTTELVPANLGSSTGATTGVQTLTAIILGNWSELLIGEWSGIDLLVDPYSESTKGVVNVTAFKDCDIALRHAESFSAAQEINA